MSLPRERTTDRQIADNGIVHYSDINIAVGTCSFARVQANIISSLRLSRSRGEGR